MLLILIISMCFSSFIDKGFYKIISTKKNIISNGKLIVHFIDVGQADAIAINFPNGEVAVIDTGSVYSANNLINYIDSYVMPIGNNSIDYLFFSHADSDHTGGIRSILFNYEVKNIIRPRQYAFFENLTSTYDAYFNEDEYTETMYAIYDEVYNGANLICAEDLLHFNIGGANLNIFYPKIKAEKSNNFSYFIKIEYKDHSLLFTGDADENIEKEVVERYAKNIDCDILKVAHHGSDTSTSGIFLSAVSPEYAVISVGNNYYGHPSSKVINNLRNSGVEKIFRTDLDGNILCCIDSDIQMVTGDFYLSKIEVSYIQFSWCAVFVLICYGAYWSLETFKYLIIGKIKHN